MQILRNIPWRRWHKFRPRHIRYLINQFIVPCRKFIVHCRKCIIRWKMRNGEFKKSPFIGPYEKEGILMSFREEQWLYTNRHLIRGYVLDMSTPKYFHNWIYELTGVDKVLISDLQDQVIEKYGHRSQVDIIGDFCAIDLPVSEESYDTVLCLNILEHCEDPMSMVKNIYRVLRMGGVAFFLAPYAYIDGHLGNLGPDYWRFGRDAFLLMARKTDFEVIATGAHGDMGKYYKYEIGEDVSAKGNHRGVPLATWMMCRKGKR